MKAFKQVTPVNRSSAEDIADLIIKDAQQEQEPAAALALLKNAQGILIKATDKGGIGSGRMAARVTKLVIDKSTEIDRRASGQ